jgi:tetratricopeptide (TPR) repeat protein
VDDAWEHLEDCLATDEKNTRALFLQGRLHDAAGDDEEAEKSWLAAVEVDPKFYWPYLYLGELYDEVLGQPVEALNAFRKYVELGGPDPDGVVERTIEALAKETGQ